MAPLNLETIPLAELPRWLSDNPEGVPVATLEAARDALAASKRTDEEGTALGLYHGPAAEQSLAAELIRELDTVAEAVAEDCPEGLARWLEPRAPTGPELAARTRQQGAELTVCDALVRVAYALWWERVRCTRHERALEDQRERERRRRFPVAVPLGYLEPLQDAFWSPGRTLAPDGSGALLGADGRSVAHVAVEFVPDVAVWLSRAGGVMPLRLFRYVLRRVTRRWADLDPRPEVLWVPGGRSGLAAEIGAHHKGEVTAALELGQFVRMEAPGWAMGGLWTWSDYRGNRHHGRGWLRLTLAPELVPVSPLRNLKGRAAYLVPMPDREPPLVGSRGEHGAQLALQHIFLAELRLAGRELERYGAVHLDRERWRAMAERVGLRTPLERVLGAWCDGEKNAPPFLVQPEPWMWTLTPDLQPLIRLILEGEALTVAQRRRARVGRRKRAERRRRR